MDEKILGSHFMRERTDRGPVDRGAGGTELAKNLEEIILMLKCDVEVKEIEVCTIDLYREI